MKKMISAAIDQDTECSDYERFKEWWYAYLQLCRASPTQPPSIEVNIVGTREVHTCAEQYVVYIMDVQDRISNVKWTTERRFREFGCLRLLSKAHPGIPFPSKSPLSLLSRAHYIVARRRAQLGEFLRHALSVLLSADSMDSCPSFEFAMGIFLGVPGHNWRMNQNLFQVLNANEQELFEELLRSPYSLSQMQAALREQSPEAVPLLVFCYDFQRLKRKCAQEGSAQQRLEEQILCSFFDEGGEHALKHQKLVEVPAWSEVASLSEIDRRELFESVFAQAEQVMMAHFLRFRFDDISSSLDFEQRQLSSTESEDSEGDGEQPRPSSMAESMTELLHWARRHGRAPTPLW
jgi:hypothetical protein